MRHSFKKTICSILLAQALLMFSGAAVNAFAIVQAEQSADCCNKDFDDGRSAEVPCVPSECACISCMTLVPVYSPLLHRVLAMDAAGDNQPGIFLPPDYVRSIEHPPKTI